MGHSKGKWEIDSTVWFSINVGKKHIAMVNFYNAVEIELRVDYDESLANARLIAAAPETKQQRDDLLAACKGLMEEADNGSARFDDPEPGSIFIKAKQAIEEAEKQ